jgi:hypothetical protein
MVCRDLLQAPSQRFLVATKRQNIRSSRRFRFRVAMLSRSQSYLSPVQPVRSGRDSIAPFYAMSPARRKLALNPTENQLRLVLVENFPLAFCSHAPAEFGVTKKLRHGGGGGTTIAKRN